MNDKESIIQLVSHSTGLLPSVVRVCLEAARAVRTSTGWHTVARVNAKSVTVVTGYSWTDRYPIEKILEVRA